MNRPLAKFRIGSEVMVPRRSDPNIYGTIYDVMTFEDFATHVMKYDYAIQTDYGAITYARECDIELYVSDSFKGKIEGLTEL